jgi:hypothetical protein
MLWGRIDRAYYVLSMDDSRSIGLGDDEFYAELARRSNAARSSR